MALYTPFFERSTAKIAEKKRQLDIGAAARSAYMGGPEEMGALYGQAPELAGQMERTEMQRQQMEQQQQSQTAQAKASQEKLGRELKDRQTDFATEVAKETARFDNYEQARDHAAQRAQQAGFDMPELPEEQWNNFKQAYGEEDAASNQRTQKISALTKMYGDAVPNPQETATKMVDGIIDIEFLEDGTVMMTDKSMLATDPSKAVTYLPVGSLDTGVERPTPETGQTLWELSPLVAGAGSAMRAGASAISGQLGGPVAEETIEARQTFNTEKNSLIRALSINPRFPVMEIKRITEEINIAPQILDSERGLKARMRSIDRSLRNRIAQEGRDSGDRNLSEDARSDARKAAADMQNFLDVMGVPQKIDVKDLTMEYLEGANSDDARSIIREMTEEEYNLLPRQVSDALEEMARGRL